MNYSLLATPAEGLSGRFVRMDRERYGVIPGVTDRDYYTNGFHVPVYYDISAFDKIAIEAPYHALTNAGHISYVELDGDPTENLEAFEAVVRYMKDARHRLRLDQPPGGPRPGVRLQRHHRRRVPQVRPHARRSTACLRAHPPHHRLPGGHPRPLQRRQARRGSRPRASIALIRVGLSDARRSD